MSDYVKSTNFASKDSLASGNPLKIVKGAEIDTEFNNIATAVATKADLNSPALSGTPTAPTASSIVNTTQIATTAFVQTAIAATLQAIFPVGSIYTSTSVSTNPATLLGFGTWVAIDAGRSLIGAGTGYTAGSTGGSADAIVVSHTHTATSTVTDPGHFHNLGLDYFDIGSTTGTGLVRPSGVGTATPTSTKTTGITVSTTNSTVGSSGTNANMPPYYVVYMWRRTA